MKTPQADVLHHLYRTCVRPFRAWLSLLVAVTCVANVVTLLQPIVMAALLAVLLGPAQQADRGAPSPVLDLSTLGSRALGWLGPSAQDGVRSVPFLGTVFLLQVVAVALLTYAASLIAQHIRVRATALLQESLAGHLWSMSLRFFSRERSGELLSRFVQDVRGTAGALGPLVQGVVSDTLQIVLLGSMLMSTSVWLTLGAGALIAVHFGLTGIMKNPIRRRGRVGFDAWAVLSTTLQEGLANIRVTKSFGAEQFELTKLRGAIAAVSRANWRYGYLEQAEAPLRAVVDAAAVLGILLIAVVQLRAGTLTTQGVLLYLVVGRMVIAPISHIASYALALQGLLASYDRLRILLAEPREVTAGSRIKETFETRLEVAAVSFAYRQRPVIDEVSLEIRRGEMVAFVGPSGAGKSTLVDLILRMYDPDRGVIRIDGIDVRELQPHAYLKLFGVVPQESLLFHDTVRNNILFGRPDLTDADVLRAAHIANADGFIRALPYEYDTPIGDRGVRLSGGERQRIAIARAVAHRPQILVLDEATSSLDTESERQVQAAIEQVVKETTAIVIAHRLSTVLHADRIVVLEGGRVLDMGRHAELHQRCGLYRSLCEQQFQPAETITAGGPVA